MDPFTGLGSTSVACARLGISFIGADIDETYLKEAISRTETATVRTLPGRGEATMARATLRRLKTEKVKLKTSSSKF